MILSRSGRSTVLNDKVAFLLLGMGMMGCRHVKEVEAECGAATGTISNEDYLLSDYNFSCDTNPIDISFSLNSGSFNTHGGLVALDVGADFTTATGDWSAAGADLVLNVGSTTSTGETTESDGVFNVYMVDGHDPLNNGSDSIALTWQWHNSDEAVDCDMEVYTQRSDTSTYDWVANGTITSGDYSVLFMFAHELGHCIGVADQSAPSTVGDLMWGDYSSGVDYPGLQPDEIEAAIFLYGPA